MVEFVRIVKRRVSKPSYWFVVFTRILIGIVVSVLAGIILQLIF